VVKVAQALAELADFAFDGQASLRLTGVVD
jgi:hypothetical protein